MAGYAEESQSVKRIGERLASIDSIDRGYPDEYETYLPVKALSRPGRQAIGVHGS